MNNHLLHLVLALAATEVLHNYIECQQVRKKLSWLKLTTSGKPYHNDLPFEVDTRLKSYALSLLGLMVFTAAFYGIFSWLKPPATPALVSTAALLLTAHLLVAYLLDKYHVEIGALTNEQKSNPRSKT